MTKHKLKLLFSICMSLAAYGCVAHKHTWGPKDMSSEIGKFVEADLNPRSFFCGFLSQCTFNLHYFFSANYDADDHSRKTILYISGGPGDIVDRSNPSLDALRFANIVYFDVRGSGLSTLPESNAYDHFLRAEYVVEDIERIRKDIFRECSAKETTFENQCKTGRRAWDAIYAHSWGTIVAQRYAAQYPKSVEKLILSAPVSRGHTDTEPARIKVIVDNLMVLLRQQRKGDCKWPKTHPMVQVRPDGNAFHPETNNFCFLNEKQIRHIGRELGSILTRIADDYGSVSFANSFYRDLVTKDSLYDKYPYSKEFFTALRTLELFGTAPNAGFQFDPNIMQNKMSAAFFLAYYLLLDKDIKKNLSHPQNPANPAQKLMQCDSSADLEFLKFFSNTPENAVVRFNFCQRVIAAGDSLREQRSTNDSLRARTVLGVYDGLTRWIFRMMEREHRLDLDGCFTGNDIQDVALGKILDDKKVIREQSRRLGASSFDRICPWDPALYTHRKPTLILTGNADPVTAGGQARYFFEYGLTPGKRALIEFPGAGHSMVLQAKVQSGDDKIINPAMALSDLVYLFLEDTIDEFIQEFQDDEDVIQISKNLGLNLMPRNPEMTSPQQATGK